MALRPFWNHFEIKIQVFEIFWDGRQYPVAKALRPFWDHFEIKLLVFEIFWDSNGFKGIAHIAVGLLKVACAFTSLSSWMERRSRWRMRVGAHTTPQSCCNIARVLQCPDWPWIISVCWCPYSHRPTQPSVHQWHLAHEKKNTHCDQNKIIICMIKQFHRICQIITTRMFNVHHYC